MKFRLKDIIKHELIGLQLTVAESKNKANAGLRGKIIDETKSTLTIKDSKGKRKMLFKNSIKIELEVSGRKVLVDGARLVGRPEERIKK